MLAHTNRPSYPAVAVAVAVAVVAPQSLQLKHVRVMYHGDFVTQQEVCTPCCTLLATLFNYTIAHSNTL